MMAGEYPLISKYKTQPWSEWIKIVEHMDLLKGNGSQEDYGNVTLLPRQDVTLCGLYPKLDARVFVTCSDCSKLVPPTSFKGHFSYCHTNKKPEEMEVPHTSGSTVKKKSPLSKSKKKSILPKNTTPSPLFRKSASPQRAAPIPVIDEIPPPVLQPVQVEPTPPPAPAAAAIAVDTPKKTYRKHKKQSSKALRDKVTMGDPVLSYTKEVEERYLLVGEGRGPIPEEEQYLVVGEGRGPMPEEEQYLLVGGRVPIPEISPPLFMQTDVLLPTSHLNNIVLDLKISQVDKPEPKPAQHFEQPLSPVTLFRSVQLIQLADDVPNLILPAQPIAVAIPEHFVGITKYTGLPKPLFMPSLTTRRLDRQRKRPATDRPAFDDKRAMVDLNGFTR